VYLAPLTHLLQDMGHSSDPEEIAAFKKFLLEVYAK
jgi:hypothetical protein